MKPKPGGRTKKKSEDEFAILGGEELLLNRLVGHPALQIIERLHQEDMEKTKAAELLEKFNRRLDGYRRSAHQLMKISATSEKARQWLVALNEMALGVVIEKSHYQRWKRKGNFMFYPDRYFYAGFLVPYTAFLNSRGKGLAKWGLIERWMTEVLKVRATDLKQWWAKEVIRRKTWPPKSVLFALASGAAVFFEEKEGKKMRWATEWSSTHANRPAQFEDHPVSLKRRLEKRDIAYLEAVFKYVPLARKNLIRAYGSAASIKQSSPDTLQAILERERSREMEALPLRSKLRINQQAGRMIFDIKAERERLKKQLEQGTTPRWRRILQREMKETLEKANLKNGDGL